MIAIKKSNIYRSLKIIWESSKNWSLLNALVVFLNGTMPLMIIWIIQLLVDVVSNNQITILNIVPIDSLLQVLILAVIVFMLNAVLSSIAGIIKEKHSYCINDAINNLIHKRTTNLDFENFDDFNFQNLYYRAVNEASYRPSKIYYGFVGLIQNSITLILIAGLLTGLSWTMLLFLALISIPIVCVRLNFSKRIFNFKKNHTEDDRKVKYYNTLLTSKQFAKELRIFSLAELFKKRYEYKKDKLRSKQFSLSKQKTKYEFVIQVFTAIALLLVFGYIANQAIGGEITQGQMVMFFLAMYRGHSFLQDALARISGLYEDGLFLKYFFEFIDFKVIQHDGLKKESFPDKIKEGIELKGVSFKYPNSSRHVFKDFNLKIFQGETVALVGANGAGKSTLVKLLCGLYEPDVGSITIDGTELTNISKKDIAENVSVVFQDFMLYNVSAKENIWFGNIHKSPKGEELFSSARKSGIDDLLKKLPNGYDTTLGTLFKDSEMLSLGEWQRVALSRCFFNNAQLVILDEPTSSLDAYTEAGLIQNFKSISEGRTAILVSHRLSTIHLADRIVLIGKEGVIEQGNYDHLIRSKGAFYEMFISSKS